MKYWIEWEAIDEIYAGFTYAEEVSEEELLDRQKDEDIYILSIDTIEPL